MNILCNMSAPPRSRVNFTQEQLKKYVAFDPSVLAYLIVKNNNTAFSDIKFVVKDYVKKHPDFEKNIKKPSGYILGEIIDLYEIGNNGKELDKYDFVICKDIDLLIYIFCSTVNDLYIPNRKLSFNDSNFDKILLFPIDEVNS